MTTIGVLSSISFPKSFRNAFESQLGRASDSIIYFDQVGYDKNLLAEAATAFTTYAKVDLVVTFGGTIAYNAINSLSGNATYFISLVGAVPPTSGPTSPTSYCLGGVSLETANHNTPQPVAVTFSGSTVTPASAVFKNKDRVAFFSGSLPGGIDSNTKYYAINVNASTGAFTVSSDGTSAVTVTSNGSGVIAFSYGNDRVSILNNHIGCAPSEIALLFHSASGLAVAELTDWQRSPSTTPPWPNIPSLGSGPGGPSIPINVMRDFARAFDSLRTIDGGAAKMPKALIVSADPFFQSNKEALISAANNSSLFICYPLDSYCIDGASGPARGRSMMYGPSLHDAVKQMGTLAKQVVGTTTQKGFTTSPYPIPTYL